MKAFCGAAWKSQSCCFCCDVCCDIPTWLMGDGYQRRPDIHPIMGMMWCVSTPGQSDEHFHISCINNISLEMYLKMNVILVVWQSSTKMSPVPLRWGGGEQQQQMAFAIIPLLYLSFSLALSQKPIWLIKCFVCSVALIHFGHVTGRGYKPGTRSH